MIRKQPEMRFLFTKHETMVEISSMFPFLGNDKHILKQKKNLKCKAHFGIDQVNDNYIMKKMFVCIVRRHISKGN